MGVPVEIFSWRLAWNSTMQGFTRHHHTMSSPNPQHQWHTLLAGYLPRYPRLQACRRILTCFNLKLSFQTHREGEQKLVPPIHLVRMHWPRRKTCFGLQIEIYRMLMQKHFAFKIWNHQNDSSISGFARVSEHDWVWSPTWLRFLRLWIFCFPDFTCQRLMQCQSEEKYWAADPWLRFELVHTRVLRAYGMEGDLGWQGRMETNVLKKIAKLLCFEWSPPWHFKTACWHHFCLKLLSRDFCPTNYPNHLFHLAGHCACQSVKQDINMSVGHVK